MQHSSLVSFLNDQMSGEQLWQEIKVEVTACIAATSKGAAGSVLIGDGAEVLVTRQHIEVLLAALAEDELPLEAASYVADALIMSEDFSFADATISQILFFLSDESAPLTQHEVETARIRFSEMSQRH
jgi:hypothetical protein